MQESCSEALLHSHDVVLEERLTRDDSYGLNLVQYWGVNNEAESLNAGVALLWCKMK